MQYEVEVKSLLGSKEKADALRDALCARNPGVACTSRNKQLNHYFIGGDIKKLGAQVESLFDAAARARLHTITDRATNASVRTRDKDGVVYLVIKASVGDPAAGTSSNGVMRMEFEEPVALTLEGLDQKVLDAGFTYQAKWSREREEYAYKGLSVCLDKNAGYGFLAEFEKMVDEEADITRAREEVRALMEELGVEELSQERLERMFAFYNANWQDYYGTDKIFIVE